MQLGAAALTQFYSGSPTYLVSPLPDLSVCFSLFAEFSWVTSAPASVQLQRTRGRSTLSLKNNLITTTEPSVYTNSLMVYREQMLSCREQLQVHLWEMFPEAKVAQTWWFSLLDSNLDGLSLLYKSAPNYSLPFSFVSLFSLSRFPLCLSPLFRENIFKAGEGGSWRGLRWGDQRREIRRSTTPMQAHTTGRGEPRNHTDAHLFENAGEC